MHVEFLGHSIQIAYGFSNYGPDKRHKVGQIEQGVTYEHQFESSKAYGNPFIDVTFDGVFECDGKTWVVPAFWIGGRRWAIRFAPPSIGDYSLTIRCSDSSNAIARRPALNYQKKK